MSILTNNYKKNRSYLFDYRWQSSFSIHGWSIFWISACLSQFMLAWTQPMDTNSHFNAWNWAERNLVLSVDETASRNSEITLTKSSNRPKGLDSNTYCIFLVFDTRFSSSKSIKYSRLGISVKQKTPQPLINDPCEMCGFFHFFKPEIKILKNWKNSNKYSFPANFLPAWFATWLGLLPIEKEQSLFTLTLPASPFVHSKPNNFFS